MNKFRQRGTNTIPQSVTPHRAKAQLRWILKLGTLKQQPLDDVMALAERIKEGKPKVNPRNPEDGYRLFCGELVPVPFSITIKTNQIDLRKRYKRK